MSYIELNRGDSGDIVKVLQSQLNKVGAMLLVDGDFGKGTETGVRYAQDIAGQEVNGSANIELWTWVHTQPEPFPLLHTNGVALIAKEETGGLGYYNVVTRWPHFPGSSSGVTIGVGYDLRFNTLDNFTNTWGQSLSDYIINELSNDISKAGSKKRVRELKSMGIEVPFKFAWKVFINETLPRFYDKTINIYPSLPKLPNLCKSVLVSIVYNRGSKLKGSTRKEMKNIQNILKVADDNSLHKQKIRSILMDIEDEIVSMQRLWDPDSGVYKRRQIEANLWRQGINEW